MLDNFIKKYAIRGQTHGSAPTFWEFEIRMSASRIRAKISQLRYFSSNVVGVDPCVHPLLILNAIKLIYNSET